MKGQWFLISAVIATGAFLSISLVLKDYFVVDASGQARLREDYLLWDLRDQFESVVSQSSCEEMEKRLNAYIAFARARLWESGYIGHVEYARSPDKVGGPYNYECDDTHPLPSRRVKNIEKGIVVASESAVYSFNLDPKKVILKL